MIFQKQYDELLNICKQITSNRQKIAKPKIEEKILKNLDINTSNADLLTHLIVESLLKRIDRKLLENKNIYVQKFDIPQITLFYSMAEAVPFVFAAHELANQYITNALGNSKTVTLFDIGIGKGLQIKNLLLMLRNGHTSLETINIIALDPDKQNLEEFGKSFDYIKGESQFNLQYYPMCTMIESISDRDYEFIKETGGKNIIINSAFSLHHTAHPPGDTEIRTNLLKKLAELNPLILTLIEPHSDHDTEDLTKRFHNSWHHFGNIFELIDESGIDISHKFTIKEKFFGREIRDIFGVSDYFRCERHELYDSWLLRLYRAGFKPVDFLDVRIKLPGYSEYRVSEGLIRLNYNDTTIVAVFGYVCN